MNAIASILGVAGNVYLAERQEARAERLAALNRQAAGVAANAQSKLVLVGVVMAGLLGIVYLRNR